MDKSKRIVIIGATSGIGYEIAKLYISAGWQTGLAGRRVELLEPLRQMAPERVCIQYIDVTATDAEHNLNLLIEQLGGMDLFLLSSGTGSQNAVLDPAIELLTVNTNGVGFVRMITSAYRYFTKRKQSGHIAAITSIAGTKGLGIAPAYSATKRFQNCYLEALDQLACMEKTGVSFTDIRPGFVDTPLLKSGYYPMKMKSDFVAEKIVKAISQNKRRVVIDWRYAIIVFFWKLIPSGIWRRLPIR